MSVARARRDSAAAHRAQLGGSLGSAPQEATVGLRPCVHCEMCVCDVTPKCLFEAAVSSQTLLMERAVASTAAAAVDLASYSRYLAEEAGREYAAEGGGDASLSHTSGVVSAAAAAATFGGSSLTSPASGWRSHVNGVSTRDYDDGGGGYEEDESMRGFLNNDLDAYDEYQALLEGECGGGSTDGEGSSTG